MPHRLATLIALISTCTVRYPTSTMNARGERILVFGDSLTQHAGSVPVWDVDQGPQRASSGPGDLFASMLLDQGAEAVRINARQGRSAYNFWSIDPGDQLIADDVAWGPTKVVVVLGTNDVGLNPSADQAALQRIYDGYKASGAELWAIGPFTNRQDRAQQDAVYTTLKNVFGSRVIDGRTLSTMISPGADGIHYDPTAARALALNMTDAILSASAVKAWLGIAIGAAAVVGGALIYTWLKGYRVELHGLEIVDGKRWDGSTNELVRGGYHQVPCKSGLDAKGMARCWSRGLGALGLTREQKDNLVSAVAEFGLTARKRGWNTPKGSFGYCDTATPMFVQQAAARGVPLQTFNFDWNDPAALRKMGKIYGLSAKYLRKLQAEAAASDDKDCMFHQVAVTDDGYAIDWTASQFGKQMPTPFVFKLDSADQNS